MTDLHAAAHQEQPTREQQRVVRERAEAIRERMEQRREELEAARERREAERERRETEREAREAAQGGGASGGIEAPPPPPPFGQEPQIIVRPRGPWEHEPGIPGEVVDIVGMLTFGTAAVLILRPLMRAFANRFERRGMPPTALPPEVTAHMERLEQAIEAVAIEVERISEGQRYTTKLLSDRAGKEG